MEEEVGGGRMGAGRLLESLALYKSFNTLWNVAKIGETSS